MATKHGKNGVVKIGATGGSAQVLQLKGYTIDEKVDTADNSACGQNSKTHLTGMTSWSGTIDVWFDPTDVTGQSVLAIGAEVELNFFDYGATAGNIYAHGTATITGVGKTLQVNDTVATKYTYEGNGDFTPDATL